MATATYLELLTEFKPRPIRTEREYARTLALVERLMDKPKKSTAEREMIELLATLIDQFEERILPTPQATPGEILKFLLKERRLSQTELATQTGISQSTIANVIAGRRQLSKAAVMILSKFFRVSNLLFLG
jgi:HTH-type transcriptional regulator/antitoxin HigA